MPQNTSLNATITSSERSSLHNMVTFGTTQDFNAMQETQAHPNEYILKCKLSQNKKLLATCSSDKTCKIWKYN